MAKRTDAHKTGARGQRIVSAMVEEHAHWLARDLSEDFGVDLEFELTEKGVRGEILKVQVKAAEQVERSASGVRTIVERKYIAIADSCRYPLVFVVVDVTTKEAWYFWLQDWLLKRRASQGELDKSQGSWTHWIPSSDTLAAGLEGPLKTIARWEGETQLTLSLIDALRAGLSIYHARAIGALIGLIEAVAPSVANSSLDVVIKEAVRLGQRLRGTAEGNIIADQLFALVRKFGDRVSTATVTELVLRGESYSRIGLVALGILYDEYPAHIRSLGLPKLWESSHPDVAYYCAWREAYPDEHSSNVFANPTGFVFGGITYRQPEMFWDKYANRGPSALLDHVVPCDERPDASDA
jgi:hypothetical protein